MIIGGIAVVALAAVFVVLPTYFKPSNDPEQISSNDSPSTPAGLKLPGSTTIPTPSDPSLWNVVNREFPLEDSSYRPTDLVLPNLPTNQEKTQEEQMVRQAIVDSLSSMLAAAESAGYNLFIASGYRSFDLQTMYYTNYVNTYGQTEADMFSARPGTSEHQTGLAVDLSLSSRLCYLEVCFGETEAGKWLSANAHEYGFIIRYPQNKSEVTGYQFEPWHLRFVGEDLAKALGESEMTLDEARPYITSALSQP